MKRFSNLKVFSLFIFLTVTLIFIGINLLDAQVQTKGKPPKPPKPPKEEVKWEVKIPGIGSDYNLFGYNAVYKDEGGDSITIRVEKETKNKYLFRLVIFYSIGSSEEDYWCIPWIDGAPRIGFQGVSLSLYGDSEVVAEEYPCFFPNYQECTGLPYPMNNLEDAVEYAPYVMAHFLNEWSPEGVNLHTQPYCDIGCNRYPPYMGCEPPDCPNCVYRYVDIRITVDCNIENIEDGGSASPTAQVWVEVVNNSDLQTGNEDWHNVSGLLKRDASVGKVHITRIDDSWTIDVNADDFQFVEYYRGKWRNRWEWKIPYGAYGQFNFQTTWTRVPISSN